MDTLGLVWGLCVSAANVQDRDGALLLFRQIERLDEVLQTMYADGSYRGALQSLVAALCDWKLVIVEKPEGQKDFAVLPKRWIIERTFAWMGKYRRLSKDYEFRLQNSQAMIYGAMTNRMLRLLAKPDFFTDSKSSRRIRQWGTVSKAPYALVLVTRWSRISQPSPERKARLEILTELPSRSLTLAKV